MQDVLQAWPDLGADQHLRRDGGGGCLPRGMRVTIFLTRHGFRPCIEGAAAILAPCDAKRALYWVIFEAEGIPRLRRVHHAAWQADPEQALSALLIEWRAATSPALSITSSPTRPIQDGSI